MNNKIELQVSGDYNLDTKLLIKYELRYDYIKRGQENLSNNEMLLFLDELINYYNEYINFYGDKMDDTDYELALFRKSKCYDLRAGIQEINDYINSTLYIIHQLKISDNK